MPNAVQLIQQIIMQGSEAIVKQFNDVTKAGTDAASKIKTAFDATKSIGTDLTSNLDKIQTKLAQVRDSAVATGKNIVSAFRTDVIKDHTANLVRAEAAGRQLGSGIRDIATGVGQLGSKFVSAATNQGQFFQDVGSGVRSAIATIGTLVATLLAVPAAFFSMAKSASSAASKVKSGADAAGVTTDEYQKLAFAAGRLGADSESLAKIFSVLNDAAGKLEKTTFDNRREQDKFGATMHTNEEFLSGSAKLNAELTEKLHDAGGAFARFGIAVVDSAGKSRGAIAILRDVADNIAAIHDPADQAARSIELFGRRIGKDVLPLLKKGSEGIDELGKKAESLHQILTPLQIQIGRDFKIAVGTLTGQFFALRNQLGLTFAPSFTALANKLTDTIVANWSKIIDATKPLVTVFQTAMAAISKAIEDNPAFTSDILNRFSTSVADVAKATVIAFGLISVAFHAVGSALEPFATLFNSFTQDYRKTVPEITGMTLAWTIEIFALFGGFGLLAKIVGSVTFLFSAFGKVFLGITKLLSLNPWTLLIGALILLAGVLLVKFGPQLWEIIKAAWNGALEKWKAVEKFFVDSYNYLTSLPGKIWDAFIDGLKFVAAYIMTTWVGTLISAVQKVINKFKELIEWINRSKASSGPDPSLTDQFGPPSPLASGGHVRGPGGPTGDKIPAMLSDNEFVSRAAAVRKYGVNIFHALNSLQLPKNFFHGLANGGLASLGLSRTPLHMAGGGAVKAQLRPFNLHIGSDVFADLLAPESVADKLAQVSTLRRVSSGGRKPTHYGRGK